MGRKREIEIDQWLVGYMERNHLMLIDNRDDPATVANYAINRLDGDEWRRLKAAERQHKRRKFKRWCKDTMGTDVETWDQLQVLFGGELGEAIADTGKEAAKLIEKLPEGSVYHGLKAPVRVMGIALSSFIYSLHAELQRHGIDDPDW